MFENGIGRFAPCSATPRFLLATKFCLCVLIRESIIFAFPTNDDLFALFERSRRSDGALQLLPPRRAFIDSEGRPLKLNAKLRGGSGRRKLCATDWDGDGRFDLLVNSTNADLLKQVDARDGVWVFRNAGAVASAWDVVGLPGARGC